MIDTLNKNLNRLRSPEFFQTLGLKPKSYFVLTLHRPSNVDGINQFRSLLEQISKLTQNLPVIFPVHPRTKKLLDSIDFYNSNFHYTEPQGYLNFIYLIKHAKAILTDSGGITEEATVLNVPCITFRNTTERPETCEIGTNLLVGNDPLKIEHAFSSLFKGTWKKGGIPPLWDGNSAKRIVEHILDIFQA
jgi:UDP-N-acetylglucosamine 2-epimerase (non-hydrolysing)